MKIRYVFTAISAVALFSSILSVVTISKLIQKEQSLYALTHTLIQCNGDYVVYQGNRESAYQWIRVSCPTDFNIPANQGYDDTL